MSGNARLNAANGAISAATTNVAIRITVQAPDAFIKQLTALVAQFKKDLATVNTDQQKADF